MAHGYQLSSECLSGDLHLVFHRCSHVYLPEIRQHLIDQLQPHHYLAGGQGDLAVEVVNQAVEQVGGFEVIS